MSLCRSNQQPPSIHIKSNKFQPCMEPVAKDLNLHAVPPDHLADTGCLCAKLLGVQSNEKTEATSHVNLLKLSGTDNPT